MIYLFLNFFLALAWMMLNGSYSSLNFVVGFTVGFFALRLSQPFGLKTSILSFMPCLHLNMKRLFAELKMG